MKGGYNMSEETKENQDSTCPSCTGTGKKESHYKIGDGKQTGSGNGDGSEEKPATDTDEELKKVWDKLLEKLKEDNVYIELDKAYTFDLDKIYKDEIFEVTKSEQQTEQVAKTAENGEKKYISESNPKKIPVGVNTVLFGNGSKITSNHLHAESFDFFGTHATLYGFETLPYRDSIACQCLKIVDTKERFLEAVEEKHTEANCDTCVNTQGTTKVKDYFVRVKCVPNLVCDFNEEDQPKNIELKVNVIQGEGLTIQNCRDLQITFNCTKKNKTNSYDADAYKYSMVFNTNIINCSTGSFTQAGSTKSGINNRSCMVHNSSCVCQPTFYECNIKWHCNELLEWLDGGYFNFRRSNISLLSNGRLMPRSNRNCCTYKDCNIYLDKCYIDSADLLSAYADNCYIYGEVVAPGDGIYKCVDSKGYHGDNSIFAGKTGESGSTHYHYGSHFTNCIIELKLNKDTKWKTYGTGTNDTANAFTNTQNTVINNSEGYLGYTVFRNKVEAEVQAVEESSETCQWQKCTGCQKADNDQGKKCESCWRGVKFLSTEDIRNADKLKEAGIPIDESEA